MKRTSRTLAWRSSRRKRMAGLLALTAATLLIASCSSNGSSPSSTTGAGSTASAGGGTKGCGDAPNAPAGADLAFYCHKTITFIVDDAPGSDNDREMQALKPGLEKYLGATIKAVYYPGASVIGENKTTTAAPDGLTIGEASIKSSASYIFAGKDVLNFDVTKISYLWVTPPVTYIISACKGSPFQSLDSLVTSKSPVKVVDIANYLLTRLLFSAYSTPVKWISGYSGSDLPTACLRGDGDIASAPPGSFVTSAQNAMVPGEKPLMITRKVDAGSTLAFLNDSGAPTMTDYVTAHPVTGTDQQQALQLMLNFYGPQGMQGGVVGPPDIPAARLLALQAAFKAAQEPDAVKSALIDIGVSPDFVDPTTAQAYAKSLVDQKDAYAKYAAIK